MRVCYLLLFALFFAGCSCQKKAAVPLAPINFNESFSVETHYDAGQKALHVTIALKDGVHAYGTKEHIGRPVRLSISDHNGWAANGQASIPEGTKKKLANGSESYVISGTFSIEQFLQPGQGQGEALLYLQVCTEQQCDRPRTLELTFND